MKINKKNLILVIICTIIIGFGTGKWFLGAAYSYVINYICDYFNSRASTRW